jgi:hypothetical protein
MKYREFVRWPSWQVITVIIYKFIAIGLGAELVIKRKSKKKYTKATVQ